MIARHGLQKNGRLGRKVRVLLEVTESRARGSYCRSSESRACDRANRVEVSPQRLGGSVVKILHGEIGDFPPIALDHFGELLGESVECCPIFLSCNLEKRLDVLGGVSVGTPISSNARNQDVRGGSVINIVGQRLRLYGALSHITILPSTCSLGGQTPFR